MAHVAFGRIGGAVVFAVAVAATLTGCSVESKWSNAALTRADEAARLAIVECNCTPSDTVHHLVPHLEPDDRVLRYRGGPTSENAATTDLELHVSADAGWDSGDVESVR